MARGPEGNQTGVSHECTQECVNEEWYRADYMRLFQSPSDGIGGDAVFIV